MLLGVICVLVYCFNPSQVQFTLYHLVALAVMVIRFNPSQVQFTQLVILYKPNFNLVFQSLTGSIHTVATNTPPHEEPNVSIPHRFNSHQNKLFYYNHNHTCFNPSQVQFTRRRANKNNTKTAPFQSLTGSIHTGKSQLVNMFARKCFNPSQVQFTHGGKGKGGYKRALFQSLTGSIHTEKRKCCICWQTPFQSLTGSIHTGLYSFCTISILTFQSLTGSIHTDIGPIRFNAPQPVSIPHRFNSHNRRVPNDKLVYLRFNPSQVQFTLKDGKTEKLSLSVVSIPHRFNSHLIRSKCRTLILFEFQSLTGSIHTSFDKVFDYSKKMFQSLTGSIHTRRCDEVYQS